MVMAYPFPPWHIIPTHLHPDADHREAVIDHLKKVIDAAALLEVEVVGTFVGKDKNKTVPQNSGGFHQNLAAHCEVCRGAWRKNRY